MKSRLSLLCATLLVGSLAVFLLILALSGPVAPAQADPAASSTRAALREVTTRYVALTGTDSTACSDPDVPCGTIQHAVDVASSGDVILIAEGTYRYVNTYGGERQVLQIPRSLTLRGGYPAGDWTAPDPDSHPTTLDAEGQGRVIYIDGPGITVTLEGLHITGGDATGLGDGAYGSDAGGGIFVDAATAIISGCTIYDNVANSIYTAYVLGAGGGLYTDYATVTLKYNTIYDNIASTGNNASGGGVYLNYSTATVQDNVIQGNTGSTRYGHDSSHLRDDGGGLYMQHSEVTIEGNTIASNTASTAYYATGGGLSMYETSATIADNTIQGNLASTARGGSGGGMRIYRSDVTILNNMVNNNIGSTGDIGNGGIYIGDSQAFLQGNVVERNIGSSASGPTDCEGFAGGLYLAESVAALEENTVQDNIASANCGGTGGGLRGYQVTLTFHDNVVQGNIAGTGGAGSGGGLYLEDSPATLQGNVIISNTATLSPTATGWGGGLFLMECNPLTMTNNLVVGNDAQTVGSGLFSRGLGEFQPTWGRLFHTTIADNHGGAGIYLGDYTTLAFTNTIIAGHTVGITATAGGTATLEGTLWHDNGMDTGGDGTIVMGTVNVWSDPLFVGSGDYRLYATSDAIDQGVDGGIEDDFEGEFRPVGSAPDIGADEFYPAPALQLGKEVAPDMIYPGDTITYTLRLVNTGNVTLTATITDYPPAHTSLTGPLTWNTVVTGPQGVWAHTLPATVATDYLGVLTNVLEASTEKGAVGYFELSVSVLRRVYLPLVLRGTSGG